MFLSKVISKIGKKLFKIEATAELNQRFNWMGFPMQGKEGWSPLYAPLHIVPYPTLPWGGEVLTPSIVQGIGMMCIG